MRIYNGKSDSSALSVVIISPTVNYIKGTDNYAEDSLIRIMLINSDVIDIGITREI